MRQGESDRGTGSPAGDSVLYDLKNLQGFKNTLDPKRYKQLAKRIHEARRVVILACDLATVLADYLGYQLSLLGLPIHVASSPGAIAHTVFLLTKQDLVIAISFRRGLRSTIEGVLQARERGAYCVGIADTYMSPLAQKCHEVFLASINSVSFGASYTAPIALANAILTAVGEFHRSRTMEIVRELAEEQRRGSRWYTS
jgi:DNA-binding MurR/RpiR family transcriptional regulator